MAGLTCIFCGGSKSSTTAHIVPESLGGKSAPVGRPGVTCDRCNQYFGQKVESKALQSFPFNVYRLLQGVPSKKGRFLQLVTTIGRVESSGLRNILHLEPRTGCLQAPIERGEVSQFRVIAEISEPLPVARMLLKMGLELLGKHFYDVAASDRVREARSFARAPKRGDRWWFILCTSPAELFAEELAEELSIEIQETSGVLVFVMRLAGIAAMIPLESRALPPSPDSLPEPEFRIVQVIS